MQMKNAILYKSVVMVWLTECRVRVIVQQCMCKNLRNVYKMLPTHVYYQMQMKNVTLYKSVVIVWFINL